MKKVLIIGAYGTIGSYVKAELEKDTQVITASRSQGDFQVDLADPKRIEALFKSVGNVDGMMCTAARGVVLNPLNHMRVEDYQASLQQKLFGQISLVLNGLEYIKDGGSFTLITGIMNRDFVKNGTAAAVTNSAVEGFVQSAALDLPRGLRINAVSPAVLEDSVDTYAELCPGFEPVSGEKVGRAFRRSFYGIETGKVLVIR